MHLHQSNDCPAPFTVASPVPQLFFEGVCHRGGWGGGGGGGGTTNGRCPRLPPDGACSLWSVQSSIASTAHVLLFHGCCYCLGHLDVFWLADSTRRYDTHPGQDTLRDTAQGGSFFIVNIVLNVHRNHKAY